MCRVLKMTYTASVDPNSDRYLSGDELDIWIAAHNIEPFGDDWQQAGTIAAATLLPHTKRGGKELKPQDFIPTMKRRTQQTPEEMGAVFESLKADHARS